MIGIDIEDLLVWTYRAQRADVAVGRPVMLAGRAAGVRVGSDHYLGYGADSCVRAARAAVAAPSGRGGLDCHPDAEAVHAAVMRLGGPTSRLVVHHAKRAGRPDWMEGARPVWVPVLRSSGKARKVLDDDTGAIASWTTMAGTAAGIWSGGNLVGHWVQRAVELPGGRVLVGMWVGHVEARRTEYALWHAALVDLAGYLRDGGALVAHRVAGPAVDAAPWMVGITKAA